MKISIKAINLDLTPSIKIYIKEKFDPLQKLIKRFDMENQAEIRLEIVRTTRHHRHGDVFMAAADLRLPRKILRAEETLTDVRSAIDVVRDTLRLEIEKYRERFLKVRRGKTARQ